MALPRYMTGDPREGRKSTEERTEEIDFWTDQRKKWERTYERAHAVQKRRGTDRSELMYRRFHQEEVSTEIDPNKQYTPSQLDAIATAWLREDSKQEMCPDCGERGKATGFTKTIQEDIPDEEGNELALSFEEFLCDNGHNWFSGEGKARGVGGKDPILFEEHFQSRKRREIYTAQGTPDPSIVSGMYNRTHPQGRKVNSIEQRKRNGASFFR